MCCMFATGPADFSVLNQRTIFFFIVYELQISFRLDHVRFGSPGQKVQCFHSVPYGHHNNYPPTTLRLWLTLICYVQRAISNNNQITVILCVHTYITRAMVLPLLVYLVSWRSPKFIGPRKVLSFIRDQLRQSVSLPV